jgi:hypothetical protein
MRTPAFVARRHGRSPRSRPRARCRDLHTAVAWQPHFTEQRRPMTSAKSAKTAAPARVVELVALVESLDPN